MRIKQLVSGWNDFFFTPQSPLPMACFRILLGLLVLFILLVQTGPDWQFWYGQNGALTLKDVNDNFFRTPTFNLFQLCPSSLGITVLFWVFVAAAFSLTIGYCTRFSGTIVWLALVSMHHEQPFNINGGDSFLRYCAMYVAMSYAGEALSVDAWLRKRKNPDEQPKKYWPWAQRMVQIQLAISYLVAGTVKLAGTQWVSGTGVYYATRLQDFYHFPVFGLFDNLLICQILTWGTLFIEFSLWSLIWFKELRYWVLLAGLLLHLGIDYSLSLPMFEWAFVAAYVTFIYPEDLEKFFDNCKSCWQKITTKQPKAATEPVSAEPPPASAGPESASA